VLDLVNAQLSVVGEVPSLIKAVTTKLISDTTWSAVLCYACRYAQVYTETAQQCVRRYKS
jgi:hypothetical protein